MNFFMMLLRVKVSKLSLWTKFKLTCRWESELTNGRHFSAPHFTGRAGSYPYRQFSSGHDDHSQFHSLSMHKPGIPNKMTCIITLCYDWMQRAHKIFFRPPILLHFTPISARTVYMQIGQAYYHAVIFHCRVTRCTYIKYVHTNQYPPCHTTPHTWTLYCHHRHKRVSVSWEGYETNLKVVGYEQVICRVDASRQMKCSSAKSGQYIRTLGLRG